MTRFGPERRIHWPWLAAIVLWLAAVAEPIDWIHELRLAAQAQALLRVLPG